MAAVLGDAKNDHQGGIIAVGVEGIGPLGVVGTGRDLSGKPLGIGVFGRCDDGVGIRAESKTNLGVEAVSDSADALSATTKGNDKSAVFAFNNGQGDAPTSGPPGGNGVFGLTVVRGGSGVFGANNSTKGRGVQGNGPDVGVGGFSQSGTGVLAQSGNTALLAQGPLAGRFEGNVQVTKDIAVDGDIRLPARDIAELFQAPPEVELLPGSVMVIGSEGMLTPSTEAYDSRVVGIVSSGGEHRPAMILGAGHPEATASIAMVGTTYCLADASDAPILPGDLLVSGRRKGHAMKALDPFLRVGAIIGKSLERLDSGQGLVRVVVALQ